MLVNKFDKKILAVCTTLTLAQTVFNYSAATEIKSKTQTTIKDKSGGSLPTSYSKKASENIAMPSFHHRKGKLSAEEVKTAGQDANKFYCLAEQKEKAGKLDQAKDLYYKSARTRSDIWGQNDSSVAKIAIKIGQIEAKQKHLNAARIWFKQALTTFSKKFGSGDYQLVPVLTMLAKLESDEKNHDTAASYYDHILRLQERQFGEENAQIIPTRISYIEELLADKDAFEAEKIANKGIEIEKRTRATENQNLAKFQQLLTAAQEARASNGGK